MDPLIKSQLLYQLSYAPETLCSKAFSVEKPTPLNVGTGTEHMHSRNIKSPQNPPPILQGRTSRELAADLFGEAA